MTRKELEITNNQLSDIIGEDEQNFQKILSNCFCAQCEDKYSATIVEYKAFLIDLNDIILKGKCKSCGGPVNRYIETGEVPQYAKRIQEILGRVEHE